MLRACLLSLLVLAAVAAEPDVTRPVDVPDPIGLGERLALIDWLREHRLPVPDDARVEQLRRAYLRATRPAEAGTGAEDSEPRERDALALALWKRHGKNARPEETVEDLRARLEQLDRSATIAVARTADDAREPSPAEPRVADAGARAGAAHDARPAAHAHAPRDATAPRGTSAGSSAATTVPSTVPPIDDDHAAQWLNYASAPTRNAKDIEVRLYRLAGDDGGVYLWAHNHGVLRRMVVVAVDDHRFVLYVEPGRLRTPTRVDVRPTGDDTLEIVDVVETHRSLPQGSLFGQ